MTWIFRNIHIENLMMTYQTTGNCQVNYRQGPEQNIWSETLQEEVG